MIPISKREQCLVAGQVGIVGAHRVAQRRPERRACLRVDDDEVGFLADVEIAEPVLHVQRPGAAERADEQHLAPDASTPPSSPGSVMCTLNASPSTRGINHSSPPPKSVPAEMFTPEATVRFHGIVPDPRNSCEIGQCEIDVPVSAIRSSSTSWQCTQCARMVRRPSRLLPPTSEPGRNFPS